MTLREAINEATQMYNFNPDGALGIILRAADAQLAALESRKPPEIDLDKCATEARRSYYCGLMPDEFLDCKTEIQKVWRDIAREVVKAYEEQRNAPPH